MYAEYTNKFGNRFQAPLAETIYEQLDKHRFFSKEQAVAGCVANLLEVLVDRQIIKKIDVEEVCSHIFNGGDIKVIP